MENKKAENFKQLKVDQWLCKNLQAVGITQPTHIQQETLIHSL
jgi:ATP-dependent RNA helicase DDX49/DBP8